ncbi:hypothetical protein D9619_010898 [Psilocybe cf. subviscida]|uniref:DUF6533 domain-containing protein n=1 Tax=Psilocybe cf. subviscida TaxID=2480587 RepID=A0A8H5B9V5_9AGAR|nr:hypothetical protein D9619_010898 [Psilocybe cf. subviscida]
MASHLSPAALKAIFDSLASGRIAISAGYAAFTLISYDYLLTFHKEVSRMWRPRKKTLVFYLFVILRYATLFYQMTFSMSFFLPIWSVMGWVASIAHERVVWLISLAALSGIFAVRTFAIYQRNYYILAGLIILATVKVFISASDFFVASKIVVQNAAFHNLGYCSESMAGGSVKWNTTSAALALAFDTIVLALTLAKTVRTSIRREQLGLKRSYSYYILRDGLLYYTAIEILLLFTVIFNQVPSLAIRVARVVIILQTSLAPTLAQRLVLNLRSLDDKVNGSGTISSQPLPPIDFAHGSVIGNIGAPLRVDDEDDDGDDIKEVARDSEDLHGIQMIDIDDKEYPSPQEDNIGFVI